MYICHQDGGFEIIVNFVYCSNLTDMYQEQNIAIRLIQKTFKRAVPFFFLGTKTYIEKIEHRVHDGEHSKQETSTRSSRTKANRL